MRYRILTEAVRVYAAKYAPDCGGEITLTEPATQGGTKFFTLELGALWVETDPLSRNFEDYGVEPVEEEEWE